MIRPIPRSTAAKRTKGARSVKQTRAGPALRQAAMLVESSADAIIGNTPHGAITTWNRAAERMYGYSALEMLGKNIALLLPKDRIGELDDLLGSAGRGGGAQRYEAKRVHKDGGLIDVALTVSPIQELDGTIVGTSTIARNIVGLKRTSVTVAQLAAIV